MMCSPVRKDICFLIGAPRSGTTWLQRMLQAHPAICGGEESHFFRLFTPALRDAEIWQQEGRRDLGPLAYIDREAYEAGFRDMWMRIFGPLYAENPGALVHLEKTPEHALCIPEVVRIFPRARFVLLVRDSRAVSASLMAASKGWGRDWAPRTAREAAATWRRYTRVALNWHGRNPDHPFLIVRYEDLLERTEEQLERILTFVLPENMPPETNMALARYEAGKAEKGDVSGFARVRGARGWKTDLSFWQKLVIWKETWRLMRILGYEIRPL